jgi:hypothetical protein
MAGSNGCTVACLFMRIGSPGLHQHHIMPPAVRRMLTLDGGAMRALPHTRARWRLCLGMCWALLLAGPLHAAAASATDWVPIAQGQGREGISTWARHVDGLAVKAFRGSTEVPHTVPEILAVLADIGKLPQWIYQCQAARQLPGFSPDHTYAQFKGMWPAADRDVLMQSTVSQQDDGSILLESRQAEGYALQEGFVRIPYLRNSFRLMPLRGGWTRLTFETQVDLGGLVPAWVINLVATKAPFATIEGLRKQLKLPAYQIKSLDTLPTHYLRGRPLLIPGEHMRVDVKQDTATPQSE